MPAVGTERKAGEVEQEVARMSTEREVLDKLIQELEQRLLPVLAIRAGEAGNTANVPEPMRVPLADSLHTHGTNLIHMGIQLRSIIDRIEL